MSHPIQQVTEKIAQGEVPSNTELKSAINTAEQVLDDSKKQTNLNVHGERLVQDAQEFLESAKKFIEEKNEGDKLQKLVQHGKEATEKLELLSSKVEINPLTPDINKEAMATFNNAKRLAYFAFNSSEFRETMIEIVNLMQEILQIAKENLVETPKSLQQDILSGSGTSIPQTTKIAQNTMQEIGNVAASRSPKLEEIDRRLANLIQKMSSRPETKEAKDHFFNFINRLANKLKSMEETTTKVGTQAIESPEMTKLWDDLKDFIEGFTGKESFNHLENQITYLMDEFRLNPNAERTFSRWKDFINDIWENPQKFEDASQLSQEIKDLIDQVIDLLRSSTVQIKFSNLLNVGSKMLNSMKQDTSSQDLLDKLMKFSKDFALDSQNRPSPLVIEDSLIQLKNLLLPIIKQHIVAFRIPFIHHSDETYDLDIASLDVHIEDVLPHQIEIKGKNFVGLDVAEMKFTEAHGLVVLKLKELKAKFSDVDFKYHRKVIPRTHDEGKADIDLSQGKGIYIKIAWKITSSKDGLIGLSLDSVKCDIDKLKLRIKHSKHNLLENFAATLFSGWVQQRAAESIVNTIIDTIQPYNEAMSDFFKQINFHQFAEQANKQLKEAYEHGISMPSIPSVGEVVQQAKETYESAKQKVSESVEKVSSTIEEVKRPIVGAVEQAKEFIQENLPEVSQGKEEIFESLGSAVEEPPTEFFEEYVSETSFTSEINTTPITETTSTSESLPNWYSSYLTTTSLLPEDSVLLRSDETGEATLEPEVTSLPPETNPSEMSFAELMAQETAATPSILLEPEFSLPNEFQTPDESDLLAETSIPAGTPELVFEPENRETHEVHESQPITIDTTVRVDINEWDGTVQLPVSKIEEPSFIPPGEIATLPRHEEEPKHSK